MGRYPLAFPLLLSVSLLGALSGCDNPRVPDKSSSEYRDAVSKFYVGLAALQVGDDVRADRTLSEFTKLAPGEPAGWANFGILALRQRDFDTASQRLGRARDLAPDNGHIDRLLGFLAGGRGQPAEAIAAFRKAIERDPGDLRARYALAQEIERQGGRDGDAEFRGPGV